MLLVKAAGPQAKNVTNKYTTGVDSVYYKTGYMSSKISKNMKTHTAEPMLRSHKESLVSGLKMNPTNPLTLGLCKLLLNVYFPIHVSLSIASLVYAVKKWSSNALGPFIALHLAVNIPICVSWIVFFSTFRIDNFSLSLDSKIEFYAKIAECRPNSSLPTWRVVCDHMNAYLAENGVSFRFVNGYHCLSLFQCWSDPEWCPYGGPNEGTAAILLKVRNVAMEAYKESDASYWNARYPAFATEPTQS